MEDMARENDIDDDDDDDDLDGGGGDASNQEFMNDLMNMKEQKLLSSRGRTSAAYHVDRSAYQAKLLALKYVLGFGKKAYSKEYTEILPWLLLGNKEAATQNMQRLIAMGVTHILNVSNEVHNRYPSHFVYKKIKIKDRDESQIELHFDTISNFIQRAKDCKGRVRQYNVEVPVHTFFRSLMRKRSRQRR
jgi:hypothetical protein